MLNFNLAGREGTRFCDVWQDGKEVQKAKKRVVIRFLNEDELK